MDHNDDGDGEFMYKSVSRYAGETAFLGDSAKAQTKNPFYEALDKAYAMRIVKIKARTKGGKRQSFCHCDTCGRDEEHCEYAIDLAGSVTPFLRGMVRYQDFRQRWLEFVNDYDCLFDKDQVPEGLLDQDLGRFYCGKTCLRKSMLCFLASNMLRDKMYDMHAHRKQYPNMMHDYASDNEVEEFLREHEVMRNAVGSSNKNTTMPEIKTSRAFWELIDEGRMIAAGAEGTAIDAVVRARTYETLGRSGINIDSENVCVEIETDEEDENEDEYDDDDSFIDDSELPENGDEDMENMEEEKTEEEEVEEVVMNATKNGKRRHRVLDDDSDDEDYHPEPAASRPKRQRREKGAPPMRRSSRVAGESAPPLLSIKEKGGTSETSDANSALGSRFRTGGTSNAARKRPMAAPVDVPPPPPPPPAPPAPESPPASAPILARIPTAPVSADRIASALRAPPADGSAPTLTSRKAVVLDLIDMQREATYENNHVVAAKLSRAILTFQELLSLHEQRR